MSTKKKSLHGRKLRPKSVVDRVEGLSADHIPDLLPTLPQSAEESLDSIAELPTQQLQHLVKGRPRRYYLIMNNSLTVILRPQG